MIVQQC
jgi:hypothetical protein